jgi:hypothetical protein
MDIGRSGVEPATVVALAGVRTPTGPDRSMKVRTAGSVSRTAGFLAT